MTSPLRIAVVSTPRTGNTWVRHLLGTAYAIPHFARHQMSAEDWRTLPDEVVLQIHWRRDPDFSAQLDRLGFRVVTLARHPLDTLISILHFCVYESESEYWLLGAGGSEAEIHASMPRSRTFIAYATGPRARELLAVTPDWWGQPGVVGLRYEDCVSDTEAQLARLENEFGPIRTGTRSSVVEQCSLGRLRLGASNNHFWKGSPGLWRQLLPGRETAEIAAALPNPFQYDLTPDPAVTDLEADCNWVRLVGDEIKQTLRRSTEGHRAELRDREERLAEVAGHYDQLVRRLEHSLVLSGPVARRVKNLLRRYPRLGRWLKRGQ